MPPNPPTMQFTPSPSSTLSFDTFSDQQPPSILTFNSSPGQQFFPNTENFGLDYDILNNPTYLNDFDLAGYYNDFTLFPTNENFPQSPFTNAFPSVDSYDPSGSPVAPLHEFECQFPGCTESFPRQCELTRHEYKHTKPFSCPHCGRAFAEKRRCLQHVQSVHGFATEKDKTQCHLCKYAHVRPDAVKRHLRLKHGVGARAGSSPSTQSEKSVKGKEWRKGRGEGR